MNNKLLYLDVDSILLGKDSPDDAQIILAKHAKKFLEFCLAHFQYYWLTTYCKEGNTTVVANLLRRYADESLMELIRAIAPAPWRTLKTEAINFQSDFYEKRINEFPSMGDTLI